jgi:hypothetical protein
VLARLSTVAAVPAQQRQGRWIAQSRPSWSSATRSMPASPPQRPVHSFQSHTFRRVLLYVGSLGRNHLQTCSNCSPRTPRVAVEAGEQVAECCHGGDANRGLRRLRGDRGLLCVLCQVCQNDNGPSWQYRERHPGVLTGVAFVVSGARTRASLQSGSQDRGRHLTATLASGRWPYSRSMMVALAIPPASHIVCRPYRPPRCSSALTNVVMMRAPLAPSG